MRRGARDVEAKIRNKENERTFQEGRQTVVLVAKDADCGETEER